MAPATEAEQAGIELELNEENAIHVRIAQPRVRDSVDRNFRHVGDVHGYALGTEGHCWQRTRKRPVVIDVLTRHEEPDDAHVDIHPVGRLTEAPLDTAARHVRGLFKAVFEAVGERYLDEHRARRQKEQARDEFAIDFVT